MKDPRSILITGASSGLGAALAEGWAAPGRLLHLAGRSVERLESISRLCEGKGAEVSAVQADVTDREATRRMVLAADDRAPLDAVVANAGISAGTSGLDGAESEEQVRSVFDVNLDGVLNTVLPILPRMEGRGRGQIALMSSLAGYRGIPGAPAYCASKAAVKVLGEGLRGALMAKGVEVSVICPGYVRTPMTDANDFPMPFLMNSDRAARIMIKGLAKGKARISYPFPTASMVWLLQALPPGLVDPILARLPKKS